MSNIIMSLKIHINIFFKSQIVDIEQSYLPVYEWNTTK